MSKKPSLAALKEQIEGERRVAASAAPAPPTVGSTDVGRVVPEGQGRVIRGKRYPTYREGKVPVGGYFSPELSRALHQIALDESVPGQPRVKIQALIGEAIDMLLKDRGKSPFGER
ncbi:MAG TPA: ribbon-helix-helix domain-containing protein [Trebonia sp.]|jgi:hypothetical protein|nr:ribbon-helix-helix domain-containing protein [Trebonia sp.]